MGGLERKLVGEVQDYGIWILYKLAEDFGQGKSIIWSVFSKIALHAM